VLHAENNKTVVRAIGTRRKKRAFMTFELRIQAWLGAAWIEGRKIASGGSGCALLSTNQMGWWPHPFSLTGLRRVPVGSMWTQDDLNGRSARFANDLSKRNYGPSRAREVTGPFELTSVVLEGPAAVRRLRFRVQTR
jgi:hypothetical protein